VAECCVFGVPDTRLGEEVGVAVVLKPGETLDDGALRSFVGSLIATYKVPRYIWFMPEALPRNASGKFLRRELRDRLARDLPVA
jgi:long-chain acyl-CoA synthetase